MFWHIFSAAPTRQRLRCPGLKSAAPVSLAMWTIMILAGVPCFMADVLAQEGTFHPTRRTPPTAANALRAPARDFDRQHASPVRYQTGPRPDESDISTDSATPERTTGIGSRVVPVSAETEPDSGTGRGPWHGSRTVSANYEERDGVEVATSPVSNAFDPGDLAQRLARAEAEIRALKSGTGASPANYDETEGYFVSDGAAKPDAKPDSLRSDLTALQKSFNDYKENAAKKKYPNVEVHGVFQADSGWFGQDANSRATFATPTSNGNIQDGADFRRARLAANGAVTENMNYFFQMDFAFPGRPTFTDVWMELTKVPVFGNVRVGQWKQPFSLEVVSSFRYTMFAERSLLFNSFAPFRHIAIGFYDWAENERMTWAASVYRSGQDQFGGSIADSGGYSGVGRVTVLPYMSDAGDDYLHLGAAYNYTAPNNRTAQFRSLPEYFIGQTDSISPLGTAGVGTPGVINGTPFFVDTGKFGVNHYNLLGSELMWVRGPWTLMSEFNYNFVTQQNGTGVSFPGLYVQSGYFLTGEHRPYLKKLGAIDRIKVLHDFLKCDECGRGLGAWELAARYSYLNLNDKNIAGGKLQDMTLGLNWYLNSYAKVQLNYIRAFLDNPVHGRSTTDIYGLRAQLDF